MLVDSPTVDGLRLAAALKRWMPRQFASYIESAMWEAVGDYYVASGGHSTENEHILSPLSPIWCVCPMREMALWRMWEVFDSVRGIMARASSAVAFVFAYSRPVPSSWLRPYPRALEGAPPLVNAVLDAAGLLAA